MKSKRLSIIFGILVAVAVLGLGGTRVSAASVVMHTDGWHWNAAYDTLLTAEVGGSDVSIGLLAEWDANPGDILRFGAEGMEAEGTAWVRNGSGRAEISLCIINDPTDAATSEPLWTGTGQVQNIGTISYESDPPAFTYWNEYGVLNVHIVGFVVSESTGEKAKLEAQFVVRDGVVVLYNMRFAPFAWDYNLHK
ncbi:MAG: hypothetical protein AB9869_15190 [Verrucomicrobiia bacterium]